MLSTRLAGKVAVVTGIAAGIGQGTALMLARHGAKVVGCDINAAGAEATVALAGTEGLDLSSLHPCDMTRPDDVARLMEFAVARHGGIDILVNAAAFGAFVWLQDMDYETHWRRTLTGEVDLVFLACKAAWPHLIRRGGGAVVNFASANAYRALRNSPALAHCAGKGAVLAMSRQLAMEGAPHGIRVNTISPALVVTEATRQPLENPQFAKAVQDAIMLPRLGTPEDIGWAVTFLVSDESTWVTGADFAIDGGATAW
ncbi:SDR family NAD(P)-dependent oxidoreductase [Nitrospirillum sp. BR 11163]|uniref:SDR family NAD(P)-dependent oxidoreductase n=1 Tax=Nitrospirillum sp. BR 11163 TaxID=3104323 RepID=UPI002B002C75|nr:SDR family oxidoreductase [Nitrospirillum sp. BR 11163]MEA1672586.1 SDR family oxidoreductase [Nitrospirillum sp. BR 11163]